LRQTFKREVRAEDEETVENRAYNAA